MVTFNDVMHKLRAKAVGAEEVIINTIAEGSPKGDLSSLRNMVEYTFFIVNSGAESIDIKIDGADDSVSPNWFPKQAYVTILTGAVLEVTGTELYQALKMTVKKTGATPSTVDVNLNVRQRR